MGLHILPKSHLKNGRGARLTNGSACYYYGHRFTFSWWPQRYHGYLLMKPPGWRYYYKEDLQKCITFQGSQKHEWGLWQHSWLYQGYGRENQGFTEKAIANDTMTFRQALQFVQTTEPILEEGSVHMDDTARAAVKALKENRKQHDWYRSYKNKSNLLMHFYHSWTRWHCSHQQETFWLQGNYCLHLLNKHCRFRKDSAWSRRYAWASQPKQHRSG